VTDTKDNTSNAKASKEHTPLMKQKRLKEDRSHQEPCAARIFGITRETHAPTQHSRNRSMTNN
jgi:hypothetical protein